MFYVDFIIAKMGVLTCKLKRVKYRFFKSSNFESLLIFGAGIVK